MNNELKYTLRIDEELMEELRIMAQEHTRSVNSEIIDLIKKAIKDFQKKELNEEK